jgi:hypothetical protein
MANAAKRPQIGPRNVRGTCPPVHMNNVQLPCEDHVKCLGLHPDRKLTGHHHIFTKRKHLGVTLSKMHWLLGRNSQLSLSNKLLLYRTILKPIWPWYPTVEHGFHTQHRDPGALPMEGPALDSGHTAVCAEHSYPARPTDAIS